MAFRKPMWFFGFFGLWQAEQFSISTGRIDFENSSAGEIVCAPTQSLRPDIEAITAKTLPLPRPYLNINELLQDHTAAPIRSRAPLNHDMLAAEGMKRNLTTMFVLLATAISAQTPPPATTTPTQGQRPAMAATPNTDIYY